ncbi:MAG TPA: TetR family transcriptional regulator C-terminal domain-containing protein [Dongiaceae bacterium]|nr:TetR family transcriptional regulator C-terminal domain-containing protein [Dongiaceae bacterium]
MNEKRTRKSAQAPAGKSPAKTKPQREGTAADTPVPGPRFRRESPQKRREALIQAAIHCLGEGGMSAFRVERICAEAKVSLGLINHYFPSKTDLLIAVYRAAFYDDINKIISQARDASREDSVADAAISRAEIHLGEVVDAMVDPAYLKPSTLTVWLALWSEIVTNPQLKQEHKLLYRQFLQACTQLIQAVADERRRDVDATAIARNLIALIDGLFLERALDSRALSHADLRRAAYDWLAFHLGALNYRD